jgi:hypothetical protein
VNSGESIDMKRSRLKKGHGMHKQRLKRFVVEWSERKKAVVLAKNEEEAEQKAYDLPDVEVHQESNMIRLEPADRKRK